MKFQSFTMKCILSVFIVIISVSTAVGQTILVHGQPSSGVLTWDDFKGRPDASSSYNANTGYKFNTKIGNIRFIGDSAVITGFELVLELDAKNTWVKKGKETDELLVHEQGHFTTGILCVREIMKEYKMARFTKSNYNSLLQTIVDKVSKKYNALGVQYDAETNHSINKEEQLKWNKFFEDELQKGE